MWLGVHEVGRHVAVEQADAVACGRLWVVDISHPHSISDVLSFGAGAAVATASCRLLPKWAPKGSRHATGQTLLPEMVETYSFVSITLAGLCADLGSV